MSFDEEDGFGDFEEAKEEVIQVPKIVECDSQGRPIVHLSICDSLFSQSSFISLCEALCPMCPLEEVSDQSIDIDCIYVPPEISEEEKTLLVKYQKHLEKMQEKQEICEFFKPLDNTYAVKEMAFINKPKIQTIIHTPQLSNLLSSQGQNFCQEIWPDLSIRSTFLKNTRINECHTPESPNVHEDITMMTEPQEVDGSMAFLRSSVGGSFSEYISTPLTAKDILGEPLPDLTFMLSSTIKWPDEFVKLNALSRT
ncbi:unnamed protein product [Blepharisma stoltei]|uniref:Uncharacterized protein n=1 Tax=Blepharisma stoltei TaxID=1481888 RepID=A0AAU9JIA4_9CILI|nr:unnamed protein product [Blepharisma stoltei]